MTTRDFCRVFGNSPGLANRRERPLVEPNPAETTTEDSWTARPSEQELMVT